MIKLVIADMDGTLLNDKHEIHPQFWPMAEVLSKKDILFAVASGRQYFNLEANFERVKDRILFFSENGTHVVYMGKELHVDPLDRDAAMDMVNIGRKLEDTFVVLCGKNSAYIENDEEKFIAEVKQYYERLELVEDLTKVEDILLKVTFCNFKGVEEHTFPHLKKFTSDFKVAVAARIFIDVTSITANKGTAIKKVQKELNISPEETLAFGDYLNDLEMMQNAKYSYAMKNAHPGIIEASTYITNFDNNENGVIKTIVELGLVDEADLTPQKSAITSSS